MGISTEYTFWCNSCPTWDTFGSTIAGGKKSVAIKYAKSIGWTKTKHEWHCPDCSAKKKDKK